MILKHYAKELTTIYPCSYLQKVDYKPGGVWVSVETGIPFDETWETWCDSAEFYPESLKYKYRIILKPFANIIVVDTTYNMYVFTKKYVAYDPDLPKNLSLVGFKIDWERVAENHQGIIIAPYHGSLRLESEFHWYYPWDCASGCIWDLGAIESCTLME